MMKLLNNIFASGLELRYMKFFAIYLLHDTVVTTDCTCSWHLKFWSTNTPRYLTLSDSV